MRKKRINSSSIIDKFHRGFVYTCIGVTLYGTAHLVMRAYRYFAVVKPERQREELKMIEEGSITAPALKS